MRVSGAIFLALLTIYLAIMFPMGRVVEVWWYHRGGPPYFQHIVNLSIPLLNSITFSFPGIESVFILWLFVALIQASNLVIASRGMLSPVISWLVFLSALIAQLYIPSLVLDIARPNMYLLSHVCEPNVLCSLPVALGLVLISYGDWVKRNGNQWNRIGYG